jgi:uncharacterized protein DUF4238
MAGTGQHSIPQVLLKGFSTDPSARTRRVWVFSKDQDSYCASVSKVARERNFYSSKPLGNEVTLDDQITDFENRQLDEFMKGIRQAEPNSNVAPAAAAEAVSHLAIRTAYLRQSFTDGVSSLLASAKELLASREGLSRIISSDAGVPSTFFDEALESIRRDTRIGDAKVPFSIIRRLAYTALEDNAAGILGATGEDFIAAIEKLDLHATGREGHNRALRRSLIPSSLVSQLTAMTWKIRELAGDCVILPDCVALGSEDGLLASLCALPFNDFKKVLLVVMPFGSDRVLVGSTGPDQVIDSETFNKLAAESSHRFFVAPNFSPKLELLRGSIGLRTENILSKAMSEALTELTNKPSSAEALWRSDSEDEYENAVTKAAESVLDVYRIERSRTRVPKSSEAAMIQLTLSTSTAFRDVVDTRIRFDQDRDLDRLFEDISTLVLSVAKSSAQTLARCDVEGCEVPSAILRECLSDLGLIGWFDQLHASLRLDAGKADKQVPRSLIAGSIERLLWQFGILAWFIPGRGIWIQTIAMFPFGREGVSRAQ